MTEILDRALELIKNAQRANINLRLIGGLACKAHSRATMTKQPFIRDYDDMDFVVATGQNKELMEFFRAEGLSENKRFNALNGHQRMIFFDGTEETGTKIDVFVGVFEMCHKIDFNKRLVDDNITIPLAELFLTKLQVVQINNKDIKDIIAVLLEHETGSKDLETINIDRIAKLCSLDWGLNHTIEKNIINIIKKLDGLNLDKKEKEDVNLKMNNILNAIHKQPKSIKWKTRAVIGEKIKWYEEPEDAVRDAVKLKDE